ncbi:hypothetical protein BH11ACT5_BH11ACT5_13310 [soil metagenome]
MTTPIVFRPWTGIALTVVIWGVVAVGLVSLAVAGDVESLRRFGPSFVALAVLTWLMFWWPSVTLSAESVTVRNPLRTTVVPWAAIERIETRFGLRIELRPAGIVAAWAAPAGSRRAGAKLLRRAVDTSATGASESLVREARLQGEGEAPTAIRQELARRERTGVASTGSTDISRRFNIPVIIALVVVLIAAVAFPLT